MEDSLKCNIDYLYVIATYKCNLKCPHCDIKNKDDHYNQTLFVEKLQQYKGVPMVIFGGEPTLNFDRIKLICKYGNPESISTNLIRVDQQLIDLILERNLGVATSWNPSRFHGSQYNTWLANLRVLAINNIKSRVLVTITEDLMSINPSKLITMFEQWSDTSGVSDIRFEMLVDNTKTQQFYDRCDDWLLMIDQLWNQNIVENSIITQLKQWYFDCSRTYTLQPNGTLTFGCPQYIQTEVVSRCFDCEYSNNCQPCRLQRCCTFPKKLYQKYYGHG